MHAPLAMEAAFAFAAMAKIMPPHTIGKAGMVCALEAGAACAIGMGESGMITGESGMACATGEARMARATSNAGMSRAAA
ncbi:MAG TPA: hypothetical protein VFA87_02140, partial [Rhizomicrobium sp.]|nr:hypothetical protein [Rhizomicrobium sp.]